MIAKILKLDDVVEVFWADYFFKKITCAVCGHREWSSWRTKTKQGETAKATEIPICESCVQDFESKRKEVF